MVATPSWPGLSGPSVAARAGGDGPDKPGHDAEATGGPALTAHGNTPGHDDRGTTLPRDQWCRRDRIFMVGRGWTHRSTEDAASMEAVCRSPVIWRLRRAVEYRSQRRGSGSIVGVGSDR